jgi:hypothetical protein
VKITVQIQFYTHRVRRRLLVLRFHGALDALMDLKRMRLQMADSLMPLKALIIFATSSIEWGRYKV